MSLKEDLETARKNIREILKGKPALEQSAVMKELDRLVTATHVMPSGQIVDKGIPIERLNTQTPFTDDRAIPVISRTAGNKEGVKITDDINILNLCKETGIQAGLMNYGWWVTGAVARRFPIVHKSDNQSDWYVPFRYIPSPFGDSPLPVSGSVLISGSVALIPLITNQFRVISNISLSGAQSGTTFNIQSPSLRFFAVSSETAGSFTLSDRGTPLLGPIYLGANGYFAIGNGIDELFALNTFTYDSTFTGGQTIIAESGE